MCLATQHLQRFIHKRMVLSVAWGFGGSLSHKHREELASKVSEIGAKTHVDVPPGSLFEYETRVQDGMWAPYSARVQTISVDPEKIIGKLSPVFFSLSLSLPPLLSFSLSSSRSLS